MQTEMKQRYRSFRRPWGVYYYFDTTNGRSKSLNTRKKQEAERVVNAMNEAERVPEVNRQIAERYAQQRRLSWPVPAPLLLRF